jgi:hypothetical protein
LINNESADGTPYTAPRDLTGSSPAARTVTSTHRPDERQRGMIGCCLWLLEAGRSPSG